MLYGFISLIIILILLPTIVIFCFGHWLSKQPGLSTKEKIDIWSVSIKGVSTLCVVGAGLFGVLRYLDTRHWELDKQINELAQKTREFNISLYNQANDKYEYNFRIFNEAVDVAATIASASDLSDPDARIARMRFERLYWGQMAIMEVIGSDRTKPVEDAMINFRKVLLDWERTGKKDMDEKSDKNLKRLSLRLAHACGESLSKLSAAAPKSLPISNESPKPNTASEKLAPHTP